MKTAAAFTTKRSGLYLLLLLSLVHSSNATEMPKQLAARVRFMEPMAVWSTKDAINQERFLQAFYWASSEFDSAAALDIRIVVVHCDKEMGKFVEIGPYPARTFFPVDPAKHIPYEVWFVGKVTDEMMLNVLTEIYIHALHLTDQKAAVAQGQKALNHLQATVSVKELERKH